MENTIITLAPIGYVRSPIKNTPRTEYDWSDVISEIEIQPSLLKGLEMLEQYSHIIVLYWAHRALSKTKMSLQVHYRGDSTMPKVGVFASRSPYRPNPLCSKVTRLLSRQENILRTQALDAIDGTPIIDIKPFNPTNDAPSNAHVPQWIRAL
jgi:tRNA-Thr(GGU) m(6)t(6)A37 methyltransferase TsaA